MKRLRCLLLDANVVIHLFDLGLWKQITEHCEIVLARTVLEREVRYYDKDRPIDLAEDVRADRISIVDVDAAEVKKFCDQFNAGYLERLDAGEAESLAYLCSRSEPYLLCSSDHIVFQVLARLNRTEQGISLEAILAKTGFGRDCRSSLRKPSGTSGRNAGSRTWSPGRASNRRSGPVLWAR